MQPHKTDRARAALADWNFGLSAFERRILILSDGQRTIEALSSLLGADARTGVERLVASGYLSISSKPSEGAGDDARGSVLGAGRKLLGTLGVSRSLPPEGRPRPMEVAKHAQPEVAAMPAPHAPAARRSLAASKMYVLDMLQLQRNADARPFQSAIQGSGDPSRLTAALLDALAFLQRSTQASYSQRVLDRVAEILPEDALPMLEAQREAIASAA